MRRQARSSCNYTVATQIQTYSFLTMLLKTEKKFVRVYPTDLVKDLARIYDVISLFQSNDLADLINKFHDRDFARIAVAVINPKNYMEADRVYKKRFADRVYDFYKHQGSPLYWAVRNNNAAMIDFLLEKGAFVDDLSIAKSKNGFLIEESLFFQAVRNDQEDIAIQLLKYGANPYFVNEVTNLILFL